MGGDRIWGGKRAYVCVRCVSEIISTLNEKSKMILSKIMGKNVHLVVVFF